MLRIQFCLLLAVALSTAAVQASEAFPRAEVAAIDNGVNHVDLAGQPLLIVSAWRDNANAHGFNVVTIYADLPGWNNKQMWQIVPVFLNNEAHPHSSKEALELTSSGGADCTVRNFRLFSPKGSKQVILVLATRDFGDSFHDSKPVTFDFYRLETHPESIPGEPRIDFAFDHTVESSKSYCDVDVALKKEMELPMVEGTRLPWHPNGS